MRYSGTVMLSVIVDSQGRARSIRLLKDLDEKAVAVVQRWVFRPG